MNLILGKFEVGERILWITAILLKLNWCKCIKTKFLTKSFLE